MYKHIGNSENEALFITFIPVLSFDVKVRYRLKQEYNCLNFNLKSTGSVAVQARKQKVYAVVGEKDGEQPDQ